MEAARRTRGWEPGCAGLRVRREGANERRVCKWSFVRSRLLSERACRQRRRPTSRLHVLHGEKLSGQLAVLDAVRLIGGGAEAALAIGLVVLVVAFEPLHAAVAFKREHVRGNAI